VLMDIQMRGMSGPECVAQLKEQLPRTEIMMLTVFEEYERIYEALAAGATGYLLKRRVTVELLDAIQDLLDGGSPMSGAIARKVVMTFRERAVASSAQLVQLSAREEEILHALAQGRRPKEIAQAASVSVQETAGLHPPRGNPEVSERHSPLSRRPFGTDPSRSRG